jgi:hypothetical protein
MKHLLTSLVLVLLGLGLSPVSTAAPKTFMDIGGDPADAAKKVWFGPANADFNKIGALGYPKRVGLLSFYLFDTGGYEYNAMAAVYGTPSFTDSSGKSYVKVGESFGLSDKQANIFATDMAEVAVPKMKELFAARGMELLTPREFLGTPEQLEAYRTFRLPKSGFQGFTEAALKFLDKNPHANGAADGFLMIPIHVFSGNRESLKALDSLRQALGLDAFVVVVNNSATDKKSVAYLGSQMLFYGPNPVPLPEHPIQAKYWTPMIPYPSGTFGKGFKGIQIYDWKTRQFADYGGYAGVIEGIVTRSFDEMDKAIAKSR